jgi:peptidoglycan/LPS O-acetylase OafA/YrhL
VTAVGSTLTGGLGPGPARPLPHLPALDGLRGVAVIGVLCFHGGFDWARGGYLGVSAFFTLSGFLITNLLVREWDATGAIRARRFWDRRFRRLLPALILALVGTALATWWLGTPEQLRTLRGDVLASLAYVANWRFVFQGADYASLAGAPSPFQHVWSLAIEEQFYVLFPLLVLVVLGHGGRRRLTAVCAALAGVSILLAVALSGDTTRVYFGTDTRAAELLAGALLALWWSARPEGVGDPRPAWSGRGRWVDGAGAVVGVVLLWTWTWVPDTTRALALGGFALHAAGTALVILAATRRGVVAGALAWSPLRATGQVSYGLYLYHWPVFLFLDEARTGLGGVALFAARVALTVVLAVVSFRLVEQPVRRRTFLAAPRRALAVLSTSVLVVVAVAVLTTLDPPPSTIPYADATLDDFGPVIVEAEPPPTEPDPVPDPPPVAEQEPEPLATTTVPPMPTFPLVPPPRTVLVVGDSGTVDAAPAISAAFTAAGAGRVVSVAAPGFGLTVDNADIGRRWGEPLRRYEPDLVIAMLGGWDTPFLRDRGEDAYAAEVDRAVELLTSRGARVLWLSMLPGGATAERAPDRVFSQLPARHPGSVVYWDVEASLRGPDGDHPRVVEEDGRLLLLRKPDGWHLCPDGAARVAASAQAAAVVAGLAPPAAPGWEAGGWRSSRFYDDPPGGCRL